MEPYAGPTTDGIAERWFWLTYDPDRGQRLRLTPALDAPARALDRVAAAAAATDGWLIGPPHEAPPAGEDDAVRENRARCLKDVRRVIAGAPPRDVSEAVLLWLVRFADIGGPELRRLIFPSRVGRLRGRRELSRLRPSLYLHAPPERADALLAMLRQLRPSPNVGYIGAPTGP